MNCRLSISEFRVWLSGRNLTAQNRLTLCQLCRKTPQNWADGLRIGLSQRRNPCTIGGAVPPHVPSRNGLSGGLGFRESAFRLADRGKRRSCGVIGHAANCRSTISRAFQLASVSHTDVRMITSARPSRSICCWLRLFYGIIESEEHRHFGPHRLGQNHPERADPVLCRPHSPHSGSEGRRRRHHGPHGPGARTRNHHHQRRHHRALGRRQRGPTTKSISSIRRATSISPSRWNAACACWTAPSSCSARWVAYKVNR